MSHDRQPLRSIPAIDDELFVLVGRLCDGVASREDCARLDERLTDPAAIDCYCAMLELEASLQWWWHPERPDEALPTLEKIMASVAAVPPTIPAAPASPSARPSFTDVFAVWAGFANRIDIEPRRFSVTILLATLAVGVILAMTSGWGPGLPGMWATRVGQSERPIDAIARIEAIDGVVWREPTAARRGSEWLPEGARLDIVRGLIEVSYLMGATVILEGPASFEVSGPGVGRLDHGRLTATLQKPRTSFAIRTPTAVITDRGTQFGVEVNDRGATDVRVFQGLVELAAAGFFEGSAVLQLAAGQAGEVDDRGRTARVAAPAPKKFVTGVPGAAARPRERLPFPWDDSAAITLVRDPFTVAKGVDGSARQAEALLGTTPAGRGGPGSSAWIAPAAGWQLDPVAGGLAVTTAGAAFLPFRPEPGFVYRLSVEMHVQSGGSGWAAVGFAEQAKVQEPILDHAWMQQRHITTLTSHRSGRNPNAAYVGPGEQGRLPVGDLLTGRQVRTVVLDTTGPQWRAFFLAGDTLVGECTIGGRARSINYIGLSVFTDTTAILQNFSLQSFCPVIR